MKPIVEKLTPGENNSFVARSYSTPRFEVPWHQHIEYELILFTEGHGTGFIGNYIGNFNTGDIFFLGSNLPHCFQKADKQMITSAVVVQFREDFWGESFLQLPEAKKIRNLLDISSRGLRIKNSLLSILAPRVKKLEHVSGFERIILICECLNQIAETKQFETVSTQDVKELNTRNRERLGKIFSYTIENFDEAVTLEDIAGYVSMSVPAFCNYFKKSTKKTYIDFLNEVRIGHACKQLIETGKQVEAICYESGFNTIANFNKQFYKVKNCTPSGYRRNFAATVAK
jgi:AraC-like DNA-binding protein